MRRLSIPPGKPSKTSVDEVDDERNHFRVCALRGFPLPSNAGLPRPYLGQLHRGVRQSDVSARANTSRTTPDRTVPKAAPTKAPWPFQSAASVVVVYLSVSSNSAIAHLPFDKPLGYLSHRGSPNHDIFLMSANSLFLLPQQSWQRPNRLIIC